jgi:hypothetical protein
MVDPLSSKEEPNKFRELDNEFLMETEHWLHSMKKELEAVCLSVARDASIARQNATAKRQKEEAKRTGSMSAAMNIDRQPTIAEIVQREVKKALDTHLPARPARPAPVARKPAPKGKVPQKNQPKSKAGSSKTTGKGKRPLKK